MKFGVHPIFMYEASLKAPTAWDYIAGVARQIEHMGYDYFAPGDRMGRVIDTPTLLTIVAGTTTRLKMATSVMLLPPRGPMACATFYSAMNILSQGRMIAGVGTSSQFRDYQAVGINTDEIWPRFNEAVQALRAYLNRDLPPFKGKFYDTEGFSLDPEDGPRTRVPIWIGSWGSEAGLRRVARLADGWLGSAGPGHQSPEQFGGDKARLDALLVKNGKDPATFPNAVSSMQLFISEDKDELERLGGGGGGQQGAGGLARPAERPFEDEHAHDMIGTRAQCIDKVRRWEAAGAQALFFAPRGPDPVGQMRTFIEDVASKV